MSKVGNLRAMFETKGETSPPERGRSPGLSSTGGAESPRPLSKIRTNFVAIEKDGRIGLQRDPSSDSVLSVGRKNTADTEGEAPAPAPQESTPSFADRIKSTRQGFQMETIPQSPQQDTSSTFQGTASAGQKTAPAEVADKARNAEAKTPGKTVAAEDKDAKDSARAEASKVAAKAPKQAHGEALNGKTVERDKVKPAAKDAPKAGASSKPASTASAITTSKATTKAPPKSPTKPTSPIKAPKLPAKTPEKKAHHPEKTSTPKPAHKAPATAGAATKSAGAAAAAEASASATKKPPVLQASPSAGSLDRGVGFVKPKVKSPTRPVNLPAGLTTHTAASATKANPSRQSISRQSGGFLSAQPPQGRSPSRASVSTTGGTLRRQSSTINRPRPSFGPPPKQPSADHPITRREKEVDEGFLARMMRPTQASSSKTHEKVVTPPRKAPGVLGAAAKRPATRDAVSGPAKKAPVKAEGSGPKKAATKPTDAHPVAKYTAKVAEKKVPAAAAVQAKKAREVAAVPSEAKPAVEAQETGSTKADAEKPVEPVEEVIKSTAADSVVEPVAEPAEELVEEPVAEHAAVPDTVADSTPETANEPREEPGMEQPIEQSMEQPIEPVDAAPAPADGPVADGSVEETASEAEPLEPRTPVEAAEGVEGNGTAGLVTDGAEAKLADDAAVGMEKRTDDTTIAS